jgi:hypothetical protein
VLSMTRNTSSRRVAVSSSLYSESLSPGMAASLTNCIFCGSPNLTWEHVFPRWTHKYMPPRQKGRVEAFNGVSYPERSDTSTFRLPGQLRDWQVRCVCGGPHTSCNNGWMRQIEDAARPIMVPLILGQETRITPDQQQVIATWAVLKAIVGEYGHAQHAATHHMQRKYLMHHSIPPTHGWAVWIGSFERDKWIAEWVVRPFLLLSERVAARRNGPEATYYNAHTTTQTLGKLLIHVMHAPMPSLIEDWRFSFPTGASFFRIWPAVDFSLKWPGSALGDRDADFVVGALPRFLLDIQRKQGLTAPPLGG